MSEGWKPGWTQGGQQQKSNVYIKEEAKVSDKESFKVESGVAIPSKGAGSSKYPWQTMQAGDSFFIACANDARRQVQRNAYMNGKAYVKRNRPSAKIATRLEDGGVRIWLVAK